MNFLEKTEIAFLITGIAAGLIVGVSFPRQEFAIFDNKDTVAEKVLDTYQMTYPNTNLEIMKVKEISGLYQIVISAGPQIHQVVYATEDGKLLVENVRNLDQFKQQIKNRRELANCLERKGVKIYGALQINNTQIVNATRMQIQLLGGPNFVDKIYVDCSEDLQSCIQKGIRKLPSIQYNGSIYSGVKGYSWFGNVTGCSIGS